MSIITLVRRVIQYVSEAVTRIFAPNDDHYPATGVVPFQGETHKKSRWAD